MLEILPNFVFILLVQYEPLNLRCFVLCIRELSIMAIKSYEKVICWPVLKGKYIKTKDWKLLFSAINSKVRIFSSTICLHPHLLFILSNINAGQVPSPQVANIKIVPHIKQKHVHQILLCVLINILYLNFAHCALTVHPNISQVDVYFVKPYIQLIVISVQKYKYNITFCH